MSTNEAFEPLEKKRAKSHFTNLLKVAMADGIIDKVELDHLFKTSKKFYITREELEDIIENKGDISFEPPVDKEERFAQLYNLVAMMVIDGEVDPKEFRMCMSFGVGLGFPPVSIEELVNLLVEMIENGEKKSAIFEKMEEFK